VQRSYDEPAQCPQTGESSRWGMADLHAHSSHDSWGDGNATVEELLGFVEERTSLDLFAITDHDSIAGARAAAELHAAGAYRFDFLPGTEVTTTSGHLLCYFPNEIYDVPSLRSLRHTADFVHERGGFCILAHPIYPPWLSRGLRRSDSRILSAVDGVEIANGGLSESAQARLLHLSDVIRGQTALTGNSDAHHLDAIGLTHTLFPGHDRRDYLRALREHRTVAVAGARVTMAPRLRAFTRKRSMTRPGWVRNLYREAMNGGFRQTGRDSGIQPGRALKAEGEDHAGG